MFKFPAGTLLTVAFLAAGLCRADDTTETPMHYPPLPFASEYGGAFELTSHNGDVVTNADFRGQYVLLYFGYTSCADIALLRCTVSARP